MLNKKYLHFWSWRFKCFFQYNLRCCFMRSHLYKVERHCFTCPHAKNWFCDFQTRHRYADSFVRLSPRTRHTSCCVGVAPCIHRWLMDRSGTRWPVTDHDEMSQTSGWSTLPAHSVSHPRHLGHYSMHVSMNWIHPLADLNWRRSERKINGQNNLWKFYGSIGNRQIVYR